MTDHKATPWTADGGSEPRAVKRPTEAIDTDYQVRSETTRLGRPATAILAHRSGGIWSRRFAVGHGRPGLRRGGGWPRPTAQRGRVVL